MKKGTGVWVLEEGGYVFGSCTGRVGMGLNSRVDMCYRGPVLEEKGRREGEGGRERGREGREGGRERGRGGRGGERGTHFTDG